MFFLLHQVKGSHYDSMSDSETDDAWRAVLLSRTKLNEVKQRLRNLEEDDQFTKNPVELVILIKHARALFFATILRPKA